MSLFSSTDLWRVGLVHRPIQSLLDIPLRGEEIAPLPLPERSFCFDADPFGFWHKGLLYVFVEHFDYREKRGEIRAHRYNPAHGTWEALGVALSENFHLSYPFVFEHDGEIYLLPEAHRSGKLTLYRATDFPLQWEAVSVLLELPAIDATPIFYNERWWLFFTLPGEKQRAMRELHLAHADDLHGPWHLHPQNPIRAGLESSRPGGTAFVKDDALYLPVQDCVAHYGHQLHLLRFSALNKTTATSEIVQTLTANDFVAPYNDGIHTASACGEWTLVDMKYRHQSMISRRLVDWQRRWKKIFK